MFQFDPLESLVADIDLSRKGFGELIYHFSTELPSLKSVQPIIFLSKLWKKYEIRYRSTEMEIAGVSWILQTFHHYMEASKYPTVIYIDHSAVLQIFTQTSMTTISSVQLKMRHVKSFEYLDRFNLEIRHKARKNNVLPDALAR